MQIPTFTTSQRPLIPPSLSGIITYTRFKPFFQTKHFPIPFHSLTQTSVVKAITINHEAVIADDNNNISNDDNDEPRFIDIGYVSGVHGFQGDVRVKPKTDFPELRFSTPGRRWLRQRVMSDESVTEVELEEGREHYGKNCWILKFRGIESVEEAKMLIGATLLVTEEDKPELEDGEFYSHDLNGMRVFMKENGKLLGTVINVFNNGANDLLQISLDSSFDVLDKNGKPRPEEIDASGQLVLLPFVEAIVPDVDMNRREMHITPPKGLLEEWKEKKKFQRRLIAAKKKLYEMGQQHVSHGYQCGEKEQWSLLSHQIVGVWFLEEEKLPVVSRSIEEENKYKILMKSPWEILQSPIGSGGFISLFTKHSIADNLTNMGVEYVEVCCPCETNVGGNSQLLGLVNSREARLGIQISPKTVDPDENFDMILSLDFIKKLTKQSYKLQFDATPKTNSFVENVDKDWVTVTSSTPNSYELSCSIYSSLNACPLDKVCIVEVRE
ncbi:hypothetical protein TSUD_80630 [Trifolium subterraneum]|uniref:RimM N-terminal domain-containing protein n=1 Tax=Trifolium subterraneum TaxID=3900 RepID=A0A2Z6LMA2_TRISU|nr:hypothetical protein TSUD_80630 [Trifolium subterraneum]